MIPYFNYAKGDKLDQPRTSIRARVCADMIQPAGADATITLDLHTPQIQGFFTRPADELRAVRILCDAVLDGAPTNLTVVSPDNGFVKRTRDYATRLDAPLAIADKRRTGHQERAEVVDVIGEVSGRNAVIVDDFVILGRTVVETARKLLEKGARSVVAAVTHGVFSSVARDVMEASPIEQLLVTDSVERWPLPGNVRIVSVAPLLAQAIERAHCGESLSFLSGAPRRYPA